MPIALYTIKRLVDIGVFRDLHLLGLADADQHRLRCGRGAQRLAERGEDAGSEAAAPRFGVILPAAPRPSSPACASPWLAWLVIVAAEMLVGGTGIGYFVWNEGTISISPT